MVMFKDIHDVWRSKESLMLRHQFENNNTIKSR
jgi:hypothetical protein